ncbi:hypothetical protein C8R46DRAFT_1035895 [Mycena filopes]|nr:hypothetical protein C8R46DRAFT_1035895 [Mycena filopes]
MSTDIRPDRIVIVLPSDFAHLVDRARPALQRWRSRRRRRGCAAIAPVKATGIGLEVHIVNERGGLEFREYPDGKEWRARRERGSHRQCVLPVKLPTNKSTPKGKGFATHVHENKDRSTSWSVMRTSRSANAMEVHEESKASDPTDYGWSAHPENADSKTVWWRKAEDQERRPKKEVGKMQSIARDAHDAARVAQQPNTVPTSGWHRLQHLLGHVAEGSFSNERCALLQGEVTAICCWRARVGLSLSASTGYDDTTRSTAAVFDGDKEPPQGAPESDGNFGRGALLMTIEMVFRKRRQKHRHFCGASRDNYSTSFCVIESGPVPGSCVSFTPQRLRKTRTERVGARLESTQSDVQDEVYTSLYNKETIHDESQFWTGSTSAEDLGQSEAVHQWAWYSSGGLCARKEDPRKLSRVSKEPKGDVLIGKLSITVTVSFPSRSFQIPAMNAFIPIPGRNLVSPIPPMPPTFSDSAIPKKWNPIRWPWGLFRSSLA